MLSKLFNMNTILTSEHPSKSNSFRALSISIALIMCGLWSSLTFSQQVPWTQGSSPSRAFIENKGQFDASTNFQGAKVLFGVEDGARISFTTSGLTYRFTKVDGMTKEQEREAMKKLSSRDSKKAKELEEEKEKEMRNRKVSTYFINMEWVDANPNCKVEVNGELHEYWGYRDPNNISGSIDHLKGYKKLIYKELYPGIDVEYVIHPEKGVEYSLIVQPGADISKVKMKYSGAKSIDIDLEGNILIHTACGDITDHAPKSFYAGGHAVVPSAFNIDHNTVSFTTAKYDASQTLVIDPWTVTVFTPSFTPIEIDKDPLDNIYVYGWFGSQNQFGNIQQYAQKFNSAGVLQWTFDVSTITSFDYFSGDIGVDLTGNSYISCGLSNNNLSSEIIKLSTAGALLWSNGLSATMYENWRISFNCDHSAVITTGCGPGCCNDGRGCLFNMATGVESPPFTPANDGDLVSLSYGRNGLLYCLSVSDNSNWTTHLVCLDPSTGYSQVFNYAEAYSLSDGAQENYGALGFNGIVTGCNFLYTFIGDVLYQRDLVSGAIISSVNVPGGVNRGNGGIELDKCENVYVGSSTGVYIYSPTLTQLSFFPTPYAVTDIAIGTGGNFYACGGDPNSATGFVEGFNSPAVCPTSITIASTPSACGTPGTGTATATALFCSAPYTYQWSTAPIQTGQTATALSAGTYTVTVTGSGLCNQMDTASVVITAGGLNQTTAQTNIACGASNGTASIAVVGGTAPYTYSWSTAPVQTGLTATGLGAGTYTVTVTDASGCSLTANVTIIQAGNTLTSAITASTNVLCAGANNGSATVTANLGTPGYTYSWNTVPAQLTAVASNLAGGNYTVTVTDANGCTSTAPVTITEPPAMVVVVAGTTTLCNGQNAPLSVVVNGGSPAYIIAWTPGASLDNPASPTPIATPVATTVYSVTVTDANGCVSLPQTVTVTVGASAALSANGNTSICQGACASISASAVGGTGPYVFSWDNGAGNGPGPISVCPVTTTTYTVTLNDGCGTSTAPVTVTVNPLPTAQIGGAISGCMPLAVNLLDQSVITTGNISAWLWNFGDGHTANIQNPLNTYDTSGLYTVSLIVTSAAGCTGTVTMSDYINVFPLPVANFETEPPFSDVLNPRIHFYDRSLRPYHWVWDFGDNSGSVEENPIHLFPDAGLYNTCLMVTSINGCVDTICEMLKINPVFTFYIPSAFTPDGDGHNDQFTPVGTGIIDYTMDIYDRWGESLFETKDLAKPWDGKKNAGDAIGDTYKEDVYVYRIHIVDINNDGHVYVGKVALVH